MTYAGASREAGRTRCLPFAPPGFRRPAAILSVIPSVLPFSGSCYYYYYCYYY